MRTAADIVRTVVRIVLALALLLVGGVLIYGLGAGYFSRLGIGFPTPYNLVVTVVLTVVLLLAVRRILWPPSRRGRRSR